MSELEANRSTWDAMAQAHVSSAFYGLEEYVAGDHLSPAVEFDAATLGSVDGLSLLHLQCHIGNDTLSWARLGARVTGLDFSPQALEGARNLFVRAGVEGRFVLSEVGAAPIALEGEQFDVVYSSEGVLCWLPDIDAWARAVVACVAPGGRFFLRDGHPLINSLAFERADDLIVLERQYFGGGPPQREASEYSYSGDMIGGGQRVSYQWSHSVGEVLTALLNAGLRIDHVAEHDWLFWPAFPYMHEDEPGRWRLPPPRQGAVPWQIGILASKPVGGAG